MSQTQLNFILTSLLLGIGAAFLLLLLSAPPSVRVDKRVADLAAEASAGTLGKTREVAPEKVNIEGLFQKFEGAPGKTVSAWPRFRGADFNNTSLESGSLAESWGSGGPPVLWRVKLSEGHAGAAVLNGRVYVMDYDEASECDSLRCFSSDDGREIWRRAYKAPTKRNHGVSRTVPAVTEKYTVTMGPRCHVMCVESESGGFVWGIDLVADYGAEIPLWYTGQCPLIDQGIAVLAPGGKALMMGVECSTGKVLWQTPNPDGWKMSHSSVMPMTLLGRKVYVYSSLGGLIGVSANGPDRGSLLFKSAEWTHTVIAPSPVQIDDHRIFLTAGYGGGSMMLELRREGERIEPKPLFQLAKTTFACEQQTPIFFRDHLFGILPKDAAALRGQFVCLDTEGKIIWTSGPGERFGLGPYLVAQDKVLILNDTGELTMIRASLTGYEQLARARVLHGRDAWAPMALVDGRLLLRDSENLVCLDLRAH